MERLKDAAMLLKAKITKDETEELLIQATSEENWQTPTPILHQICNIAYNYEEWQKISAFIWQKLKLKKWRKVLKTLNMVDFILKNGPTSIISSFKHEVYVFRSLDNFTCLDEGIDRGEAIRERAKGIVQLLTNQQLLQEERTKAKTIKQRMGESAGSSSNYKGVGSKGFSSGGSKYEGYDNKGKSKTNASSYSNNDYNSAYGGSGSSNLNKYKKDLGGDSAYKKQSETKNKEQNKKQIKTDDRVQKKQQPINPAAFNQKGRTLVKPGQAPPITNNQKVGGKPEDQKAKTSNTTINQQQNTGAGFNFFDDDSTANNSTQPIQQNFNISQTPNNELKIQGAGQLNYQNIIGQTSQQNSQVPNLQGINLFGNQNTFQNIQSSYQQQNNNNQQGFNLMGQNFQNTQNPIVPNINNQQNKGFAGLGNITMNSAPSNNSNQVFTMNSQPKAKQDEFGGFDQGNQQIKWMSADQSNLINLTDLSKQVNEKNLSNNKKKTGNQGNLLATSQDFDFMSTPSTNYNLGMNFGGGSHAGSIMVGGYPSQNNQNIGWHNQFQNQQQQQQKQNQLGGISFF